MKKLFKLFIYIVCIPYLIGILLADFLGVDVSQVSAQYIGILYGLQKSGVDIQVKSIIFIEYLIIFPVIFYKHMFSKNELYVQERKKLENLYKPNFQNFIVNISLFIISLFILVIRIPVGKFFLTYWNFTFTFTALTMLLVEFITMRALFFLVKNLLNVIKIKIYHFFKIKSL